MGKEKTLASATPLAIATTFVRAKTLATPFASAKHLRVQKFASATTWTATTFISIIAKELLGEGLCPTLRGWISDQHGHVPLGL
jgi:hypothetical protein